MPILEVGKLRPREVTEHSHQELGKGRLDPRQSGPGVCIQSCCLHGSCPAPCRPHTEQPAHTPVSEREGLGRDRTAQVLERHKERWLLPAPLLITGA